MNEVEPFLTPTTQRVIQVPLTYRQRCELRKLFGEELVGEPVSGRKGPVTSRSETFFDHENRTVSPGDLLYDGREWTVIDTEFGCRYLVLVDYKGGFILLSLLADVDDVLVEFASPVDPKDRPSRHADRSFDPVPSHNRRQYLKFKSIAAELVAESEQRSQA